MSDLSEPAAPLRAAGLTKRFGRLTAVADLDLELSPGTVTGFLGPNGAGKSTTLRMVVGLTTPTAGAVTLFGKPASQPAARARLGYLPADATFVSRLSGRENLDVLASLRGPTGSIDRQLVAHALTFTDEDMGRPVGQLSSGMRQKLGIVAALQHRPDLIVLDEPANRLDPLVHRAFCTLLTTIAGQGRTVLLSSHVLGEVEEVCDRIALIKAGRLIRSASVDSIRADAQRRVTLRYSGPHRIPAALSDAKAVGHIVTGRIPAGRPDIVRELADDPRLRDIEVEPPSLEDLFLDMYTEGESDADADHG